MTLQCIAPFCTRTYNPSDNCIQLDIPDNAPLIFCSLKHLALWADYHKQRGFQKFQTAWIEPPVKEDAKTS